MKRLFLFLFSGLINGWIALAQLNYKSIYLYTDDGVAMYFSDDIDSITHDAGNVRIYREGKNYAYLVSDVDSLALSGNTGSYSFPIAKESLESWSDGYMNSAGCFIVCRQEDDGGYFAYIGQKGVLDDGVTLKFDKRLEIQSIYSNKGYMTTFEDGDDHKYAMYMTKDSIYAKQLSTFVNEGFQYVKARNISASTALNVICDWWNNALTVGDFANLLSNGNEYLSTFMGNLVSSFMAIGLPSPASLGLSLGIDYLNKKYENHFYELLRDYMGFPMLWISDIKDDNMPKYEIQVSVEGLDTSGKPIMCAIHTGIAVRMNESNVNYDNCDFTLQDHEIKSDEVYWADLDADSGIDYWLRPYAVVVVDGLTQYALRRQKYLWGGPLEPLVTYGDVDKICYKVNPVAVTGDVVRVTENTAIVKCSYMNAGGHECGVIVSCGDEMVKVVSNGSDGEREINISGLSPATTYNYWAYVDIDGTPKNGEIKSFTTELPDISGAWACTETHNDQSGNPIYETYTITLEDDGTVSLSNNDNVLSSSYGISSSGEVTVRVMDLATQTVNSGMDWIGQVDDISNPQKITGTVSRWNFNQNGFFGGDGYYFEMTR